MITSQTTPCARLWQAVRSYNMKGYNIIRQDMPNFGQKMPNAALKMDNESIKSCIAKPLSRTVVQPALHWKSNSCLEHKEMQRLYKLFKALRICDFTTLFTQTPATGS